MGKGRRQESHYHKHEPICNTDKKCTRKERGDEENQGVNKNRAEQRGGVVESWFDAKAAKEARQKKHTAGTILSTVKTGESETREAGLRKKETRMASSNA